MEKNINIANNKSKLCYDFDDNDDSHTINGRMNGIFFLLLIELKTTKIFFNQCVESNKCTKSIHIEGQFMIMMINLMLNHIINVYVCVCVNLKNRNNNFFPDVFDSILKIRICNIVCIFWFGIYSIYSNKSNQILRECFCCNHKVRNENNSMSYVFFWIYISKNWIHVIIW